MDESLRSGVCFLISIGDRRTYPWDVISLAGPTYLLLDHSEELVGPVWRMGGGGSGAFLDRNVFDRDEDMRTSRKRTPAPLAEGIVLLVVGREDKLELRPQNSPDLSRVMVAKKCPWLERRSTHFRKASYTS